MKNKINIYNEVPLNSGRFTKPVVTIGFFDGVHLGHGRIIETLRERADKIGGESFVITFRDHPGVFLSPEKPLPLIGTTEERIEEFEKYGVENVILLDANEEVFNMSAWDFYDFLLVKRLGAVEIVIGYDHHFGKNREGNYEYLQGVAHCHGTVITRVEKKLHGGDIVSSTLIRESLKAGYVDRVSGFLGRRFSLLGRVVHGNGMGHSLGAPTANMEIFSKRKILPSSGVYAVFVFLEDGEPRPGVMNIGNRPTFGGKVKTLEVHLLDFSQDVYGETIRVEFVKKIRDERKFPDSQALVSRIRQDIKEARVLLV